MTRAQHSVAAGSADTFLGSLRYQILAWVGIIGMTVTLFEGLQKLLDLAAWAGWLVANWHALSVQLWQAVGRFFNVTIPRQTVPPLTFIAFSIVCALGARFYATPSDQLTSTMQRLARAVLWVVTAPLVLFVYILTIARIMPESGKGFLLCIGITLALYFALLCKGERLYATFVAGAMLAFQNILYDFDRVEDLHSFLALPITFNWITIAFFFSHLALSTLLTALISLISPFPSLAKRMSFVLLGLGILTTLNQVSLFAGLRAHLHPPASASELKKISDAPSKSDKRSSKEKSPPPNKDKR